MSRHVYAEIYLHMVWHTRMSDPVLTRPLMALVSADLTARCHTTDGVYLHGIGGTDTHLHVALSIEPSIVMSDLIGEMKGGSAFAINSTTTERLDWQRGYGVVSFSKRDLPWIVHYIAHQAEHHARNTVSAKLERVDQDT